MEASELPPSTILTEDTLAPRGPWSFLAPSVPGGFSHWGWGLMGGWVLVLLGPVLGWAGLLRRTAGWSALPSHWGETLRAREIWELWENGGLKHHPVNSPTVHLFGLGLILVLWCGWRLQGETISLPARLAPWLLGGLDTLLLGVVPLGLMAWLVDSLLGWAGATGIQGLGWTALLGRPLVWMAFLGALNVQWWLCRLNRAAGRPRGTLAHLRECFLRLWLHPVQWTALALGGAALRAGLPFLVLLLAWRIGGGTPLRVALFLALQVLVTCLNGWLLGWWLRTVARFHHHDAQVRAAVASLKEISRDASQG